MEERGKFIVIEGPDNSGKTTQCNRLVQIFNHHSLNSIYAREPGGTKLGEAIRTIVNKPRAQLIPPEIQTSLFITARRAFVNEIVLPTLDSGVSVVCDRHRLSTEVYQGYVQGVPLETIDKIHSHISSLITPDFNFVLDVPVTVSLARNQNFDRLNQQTIYEQQQVEFHHRVREGYLTLASQRNLPIIDGTQSIEQITNQIIAYLQPLFPNHQLH